MDVWVKERTLITIYDVKLGTAEAIIGGTTIRCWMKGKGSGSGRER